MSYFSTSPAARTSLAYVTVGALTLTWTTVWLVFLLNNPPSSTGVYYLVGGCMASGALILLIGLGLGRIGRAARQADLEVKAPTSTVSSTVVAAPVESTPPVDTLASGVDAADSRTPMNTAIGTTATGAPEPAPIPGGRSERS